MTRTRSHFLLQLTTVLTLLGVFLATMSARDAFAGGFWPKTFLLVRMLVLVLLCTWFLRRSGERWAEVGLRKPRRWWPIPLLVIGGFVLLVVLSSIIRSMLLPALGIPPPRLASALVTPGNLAEYLYSAILVAWGSAAFGEEMVVRGFILDRMMKLFGSSRNPAALAAVVLQAALFGAFHFYQGMAGVLITGMVGLVIGLVWFLGGRNLWACILLHGLVDFITNTEAFTATR
ncbi:MAG: CPBP family intramembrane metalloprotease [Acidobacteriota bacterium]|nr:CPBP family intramembrane metalloprotease [Acidobacteriota bacterium]